MQQTFCFIEMTIQNINLLYGQSLRQWEQYDTILQPVLDLTTKVYMKNYYVDSISLTLSYSPSRLQSLVPQPIYHLVPVVVRLERSSLV